MLAKYITHLEHSAEKMHCLSHALFKESEINYFDYEHFYDDGRSFCLSTSPRMGAMIASENLLPTRSEFAAFSALGQRVTMMSHSYGLPPGAGDFNPEKYEHNIATASDHGVYNRLYFVDRCKDYYRLFGFGVPSSTANAYVFYLNNLRMLEQFCIYFSRAAEELIEETESERALEMPEYLRCTGGIEDPKILTSLTPELYFNVIPALTMRENECVCLLAKGYSTKAIARLKEISPRTVEQHLRNAKDKLGFGTSQQLVELWHEGMM